MRAASYGAAVAMVCEERTSLANFVAGLSDQQWEAPSLPALWRVRDVVAHVLSYDDLSKPGWAPPVLH